MHKTTYEPAPLLRSGVPKKTYFGVALTTALVYGVWVVWVPLLPGNLFLPLLDLGKITGYSWGSALLYLFIIASLYVLYGVGYRAITAHDSPVRTWHVFAVGAIFCFELVWAYPATALDVFGYIGQGRVLALHHANPLVVPPSAFLADPIIPYLAYAQEPSPYGPLWAVVGGAFAEIARGDLLVEVLLYKLLGALAQIGGAAVILGIVARLGFSRQQALASAYLYLCNPLLLWEMIANAHNDGVMLLFALAAVWLMIAGFDLAVMPALVAGALVKVPVALIGPLLFVGLWRRAWARAIETTVVGLALAILVYRPFWNGLSDTFSVLRRGELFTASIGEILRLVLLPGVGVELATSIATTLSRTAFAVVAVLVVLLALRVATDLAVLRAGYVVLLAAVLLATTWFQAWYVAWPFAFGALLAEPRRHLEVTLLSLGALLQYFVYIYLWQIGVFPQREDLGVEGCAYLAIIGPPVIGMVISRMITNRHRCSPLAA